MAKKIIEIDGVQYVRADSVSQASEGLDGMLWVVVRTYSAGVFCGYLESRKGKEGVMREAVRIHYWDGANSLSQLAMEGVTKPSECRFAMAVDRIELTEIIEVISTTQAAKNNILSVQSWKQ